MIITQGDTEMKNLIFIAITIIILQTQFALAGTIVIEKSQAHFVLLCRDGSVHITDDENWVREAQANGCQLYENQATECGNLLKESNVKSGALICSINSDAKESYDDNTFSVKGY